jgi:hypothetical protein
MHYTMTGQENGDLLIEVTALAGLTTFWQISGINWKKKKEKFQISMKCKFSKFEAINLDEPENWISKN